MGGGLPALPPRGDRRPGRRRRRPRVRGLLPRRHRCDGRACAAGDGRGRRCAGGPRRHGDAPERGRDRRRPRSCRAASGCTRWQFTLSATDANRFALRLAREITQRPKILVFDYCYHGTVDETFATLDGDRVVARAGNVGPPVDPALTTKVVQWNDVDALEQALAPGDVACVLAEPALTNIGIVLPEPGFHDALRELTRRTGTLLVIDETHTFSAGPGGCTARLGARAGRAHDREGDRRRRPRGRLRRLCRCGRADRGARGGRLRGRRRHRRHARRQRALARGRPRDAGRGAHRGGVRADDPRSRPGSPRAWQT